MNTRRMSVENSQCPKPGSALVMSNVPLLPGARTEKFAASMVVDTHARS